eukprot:Seg2447.5 transcript_id=Seg2447.5/GoldUCD/mRNA.D3Y31 product="28S ribosomal protein S9 mitochondrial" pseudo=true protein_id=Seg2447.5/GoldUCD/D3Y31
MFPLTISTTKAVFLYTLKTQNASILKTIIALSAQNICRHENGLNRTRHQCARSFAQFAPSLAAVAEQPKEVSTAPLKGEEKEVVPEKEKQESAENPGEAENIDWQLTTEMKKYELGKRWLATMMGEDVETFTDDKIAEALQYLLPSHLFAKDARPLMKNPIDLFGKRKEMQADSSGRPLHAAFYTGQAPYHDLIYNIWTTLEKLDNMPQKSHEDISAESQTLYDKPLLVRWAKQHEMEEILNCKLAEHQYDLILRRLTRVAKHPNGDEFQNMLSKYQVNVSKGGKKLDIPEIDEDGYAIVMGYRKNATAEVKLKEGSGKLMINNMPMTKYFRKFEHRQQIISPFLVTGQLGRFDVDAGVIGGGESGQAGAIRYGISRGLLSFSESFYQSLEEAGLLLRDPRIRERKKPGQKRARKKFAWVKR